MSDLHPQTSGRGAGKGSSGAWDTRQLVTMALLTAVAVLLMFIQLPLLPGAAFLTYDPAGAVSLIAGLALGPGAGVTVGIAAALVHGILLADFSGALMNGLVAVGFVLPAAIIWRARGSRGAAVLGTAASTVAATVLAVAGNLVVTPLYLGVPLGSVVAMIVPILIPFNVVKAVLNGVLAFALFPAVRRFLVAGGAAAGAAGPGAAVRPASRASSADEGK